MAGLQGRTLGGYQLTEQIASAGIAEVYRARPLASNGREVVIKVIYPEFARYPSFLPNFQHIVQTAAKLASHPHILPVVASGEENGYLYLATPWVADGTLRDWISRGGRLGLSDAGPFFHQLCSALAYAHSLGLVHGNLKPSNVFLFEGRHVLLGDFGMLWDIRQLDMNHSGSGVDVVEYLAPESFAAQFTQQSDIYSLGAMLFATLTGRPPFSGSKPADLRDAHSQYPPPRLAQVVPSLPPAIQALDAIVQQAMAKRPEERFPSAMALAQAIDTTLQQQPAAPSVPALPPAQPAVGQSPVAPVPGSWASPGPIQPPYPAPAAGMGMLPAPAGAAMQPLNPPFPPLPGAPQAQPPLAQGWPAAPGLPAAQKPPAEDIQYTERVPAPPVARPLLSRPQLQSPQNGMAAPSAPALGNPDPWGGPYVPPGGDDPDWRPDAWAADPRVVQPSRRQAAHDDDWRLTHNPPSRVSQSHYSSADYPSEYGEYTGEQFALPDGSSSMSHDDWAGLSQSGPHSEALRYRGGFSATELGLPRLTNPALQGELPPEWQDLLADEVLPSRADVGPGKSQRQAPPRRDPQDSYEYRSVGQRHEPNLAPATRGSRQRHDGSDDPPYDDPAMGKPGRQRGQPMPTLASAHLAAFPANQMHAPSKASRPSMGRERGAQRKRRWPTVLVLFVLLLTLVTGTGVVLAKPAMCPGSVCTQANTFLHRHLPFLGPPPNANVLQATPGALTIRAIAGSSTNLTVQVSNSGTDSAVWHATASVPWLTITPNSGTLPPGKVVTLSVVAAPATVPAGKYSARLTVETADTSLSIPVAATVAIGPKVALSEMTLNVQSCGVAQSFKVSNTGDGPLNYTVAAAPSSTKYITLGNASGTVDPGSSATVSVTVKCIAFWGDYTVNVQSDGGNAAVTIHYT
ncbi:MAG TPA: protein kinase [Ktedonobacterales bacterium]